MLKRIHGLFNIVAFHSLNYKVRCEQRRAISALFNRHKVPWATDSGFGEAYVPLPIRVCLLRPVGIMYRGYKMLQYRRAEKESMLSGPTHTASRRGPYQGD